MLIYFATIEPRLHPWRCILKCDRCNFISFEHNLECPACGRELGIVRRKLGIHYEPPEVDFDELFTGTSGHYKTGIRRAAPTPPPPKREPVAEPAPSGEEAELDLEDVGEDFEFTLDD
jgi:hypothetical protein